MRALLLGIFQLMTRVRALNAMAPGPRFLQGGAEALPAVAAALFNRGDLVAGTRYGAECLLAAGLSPARLLRMVASADAARPAPEAGILGAEASLSMAAGAALGLRAREQGGIVFAFFGRGIVSAGSFHEAMVLAGSLALPIVFLYRQEPDDEELALHCEAYGMEYVSVDGGDAIKLLSVLRCATDKAREGDGPTMIECRVGSFALDMGLAAEICPIERLRAVLLAEGHAAAEELSELERAARNDLR